ncbi:MAG: hypothetical protein IJ279_03725 [Clostridia bacterium]|nr:hypothetical protein [Clostridia bacterium]
MNHKNKDILKALAITLIVVGAITEIASYSATPFLLAFFRITGRIFIIIAMFLLLITQE